MSSLMPAFELPPNPITEAIRLGRDFPRDQFQSFDRGMLLLMLQNLGSKATSNYAFLRAFHELLEREEEGEANGNTLLALLPYSRHLPTQRATILTALKHFGFDLTKVVEEVIKDPGIDGAVLDEYWFEKSNGNIWSFIALMLMTNDSYRRMVDDVVGDSVAKDHDGFSMTELLWLPLFSNGDQMPEFALEKVHTDADFILYMHILSMGSRERDRNPLAKKWAAVTKREITT